MRAVLTWGIYSATSVSEETGPHLYPDFPLLTTASIKCTPGHGQNVIYQVTPTRLRPNVGFLTCNSITVVGLEKRMHPAFLTRDDDKSQPETNCFLAVG